MLKKTLIAVAGAGLLLGLFFGRDACSYLSTTAGWMKQNVKDSVPVEFELKRARAMLEDLGPEIRNNMHQIAKEETEVERLANRISSQREQLASSKDAILRLKNDLESGEGAFYYAGRRYTVQQVKADLSNRFDRYKVNEGTLTNLEQMLKARQAKLEAARNKLDEMLAAREQLKVEIENLEAQLKMVEVAETASEFHFDNSQLSRTRSLIDDIRDRIEVRAKMVDAEKVFHTEIPVEKTVEEQEEITDAISKYFGEAEVDAGFATK